MKENFNKKIRLAFYITIFALFIAVAFSNVIGKPLSNRNFVTDNKENIDTTLELPTPKPLFYFRILA